MILIVCLVRSKKSEAPNTAGVDASTAYRRAIEEIQASSDLPAREAALRLSGAIRLYLSNVCHDPSLYETHEEYIARHQALDAYSQETRDQLSKLLTQLAALKYDRPIDATVSQASEQSEAVIKQLHQQRSAA